MLTCRSGKIVDHCAEVLASLSTDLLTEITANLEQINTNFQRKIVNIFLPINFYICFGCSKEPSH